MHLEFIFTGPFVKKNALIVISTVMLEVMLTTENGWQHMSMNLGIMQMKRLSAPLVVFFLAGVPRR